MKSRHQIERYELTKSPLYRLGRGVDLAALLGITPKVLTEMIVKREAMYLFKDEEIGGKKRSLAVPIDRMRALHERLQSRLKRIKLREYVYSPRVGRTALQNAAVHVGAQEIVKLDVKQFYPSTTDEHVFQFFRHRLQMADDVAGRLTKLCTIKGRVPFGSPLSPILCTLVHDDIFSRVARSAELRGQTLTLWVDDVTISGTRVERSLVRDLRKAIASKRLVSHKTQRASAKRGLVVTGVFVTATGTAPANKSHLKVWDGLKALGAEHRPAERLRLIRSLIGLTTYCCGVYPAESRERERWRKRLQWLHGERRAIERSPVTLTGNRASVASTEDTGLAPWES